MTIEVRWAGIDDAGAVASILCEVAVFYNQAPPALDEATRTVRVWLADENPAYRHFAIALVNDAVRGLASVAIMHPGHDLTRLLYLKELFVTEHSRGLGVGEALLRFLAGYCRDKRIGRIDLTTGHDNAGARRLYTRMGAVESDKVFLRFEGDALAKLIQ